MLAQHLLFLYDLIMCLRVRKSVGIPNRRFSAPKQKAQMMRNIKQSPEDQDQVVSPHKYIQRQIEYIVFQLQDPSYHTSSYLLNHTKIKPQDRQVPIYLYQKLKSWLLNETKKQYLRETYALASKFLDMFFAKGCSIQKNVFQLLGLACLILAAKINERRIPGISYQIFDKEKIFDLEKQLVKVLNYKLNPPTYISLTLMVLQLWDSFDEKVNLFQQIKYLTPSLQSLKRVRRIFQTLDCIDLVHSSLDIPLNTLAFSVFYLENRGIWLEQACKKRQQNQENSSEEFTDGSFHRKYEEVLTNFLSFLQKKMVEFSNVSIDKKVIMFIMNFSRVNPKIQGNKKYIHFLYEVNRQTYNPQITAIAQKFMRTRNYSFH